MNPGLLLHACCAPCATVTVEAYRNAGFEPVLFFHNPNIHPYREFRKRLDTLETWASARAIPLEADRDYPLEEVLGRLLSSEPRCRACFRERLEASALKARALGLSHFATTLSVSPYQDPSLLQREGDAAAESHGVHFHYMDLRRRYGESVRLSREAGLYRQPYCGCVFSERDRFQPDGNAEKTGEPVDKELRRH